MFNLGLFIDYMHNSFHTSLISRIDSAALEQDALLTCFEYSPMYVENQKIKPESFLRVIKNDTIDGLIIAPGSLEPFLRQEHFYTFFKQQLEIPILYILASSITGPYIHIDNKEGMKKLLFHLFVEHNYRRPAFICGLVHCVDMENRFEIFKSMCREYGIHYEKNLIYQGDHSFHSGRLAVIEFAEKANLQCDVIIAANDHMAAGAMLELQTTYKLRIPEDIAVTGFDDIGSARFMNPPLTTIKQPLSEIGYKAVENIINLIKGKQIPRKTIIPAELVLRDSCGCLQPDEKTIGEDEEIKRKIKPAIKNKIDTQEPYIILYEKQNLINYNDKNLTKIMRYLGQSYADSELTISKVEKATGISSLKIAKILNEKFRIHFKQLLNKIRCAEAKRLLRKTDRYITDIAFQVGYNSRNHFYKAFIQSEGISPKEYKTRG